MVELQYLLPHHQINKLAHFLANCSISWIKNFLISYFLKRYPVDLQEATQPNPFLYKNYNDFFTRQLNKTARIIDPNPHSIVSPADGRITQYGDIKNNLLINTKGVDLSLTSLLANQPATNSTINPQIFSTGKFITIYLAPHNYHRVHMPINATVKQMLYVPGKLFSVNTITVNKIPNVFTQNERVITVFDTDIGKIAIILVGAMIVGSIVINWHGQVTPTKSRNISYWDYKDADNKLKLERAQEMGLFKLGSTVIVLFENNKINFSENVIINSPIKMGQSIATLSPTGNT